jgi:hypothetical protein
MILTSPAMDKDQTTPEDFSLSAGGPFHRALVKTKLINRPGKIALFGLCIAWIPLLIITLINGTAFSGTDMPFLKDAAIQGRLLLAIPLLIIMRLTIDTKVNAVIHYIADALMSPEERQLIVSTAIYRAKKLTNSALTEIILLIIVILYSISLVKNNAFGELRGGTSSWMAASSAGNQELSFAGHWAVTISIPIFQFLFFRWLWRYIVWILLLFRLSKSKMQLRPTHADKAGGLGIIMLAQRSFNMLFVAAGLVVSGELIVRLMKDPGSFNTVRNEIIGYVVVSVILVLLPMLFFIGKLLKTKQEALVNLSKLSATLSSRFEEEWVNNLPIEKRITESDVDPSMLFDYAGVFESVQQMRPFPVTIRDIAGLAISLFIPFIPLFVIHFSVVELLQRIIKLLA